MPISSDDQLSFSSLKNKGALKPYLKANFPQIDSFVPDFEKQLSRKTLRSIVSVDLDPWHLSSRLCFLGDAAHALFPFYGAGLNTGLQDVSLLLDLLDQQHSQQDPPANWGAIFNEYYLSRKEEGEAIQRLTSQRQGMFGADMRAAGHKEYRRVLDLMNNSYPEEFWSVERLLRFSTVSPSKIERYQATETRIVKRVLLNEGFRKAVA
jgi:kynurenine 3-monooxygenase